ncbi:SGNH/GDSL hydrolase family protein [Candidatus Magnetominusculus dajiuhuensis]|uniref:SGNH/GDSL hydrolase family protein n=1 Tax=Candidatus Magnetominusculus dajiuhuensis TaxID=3137712 RepID=UPI003B4388A7
MTQQTRLLMVKMKGIFTYISIIVSTTLFVLFMIEITSLLLVEIYSHMRHSGLLPVYQGMIKELPKTKEWMEGYIAELDDSAHTSWQSYVYFRRKSFKGKYINIDSNGFRKTYDSLDPKYKSIKVFIFGGSTAWGTFARDDYTIPSFISKMCANEGFNTSILNFGEGGYVNSQEVIALMLEIRRGNVPDIVIFYDGYNDSFSAIQNEKAGVPQNETNRVREFESIYDSHNVYRQAIRSIFTNTIYIIETLERLRVDHIKKVDQIPTKDDILTKAALANDAAQVYTSNIQVVQALGKYYRFDVLYYWQPALASKNKLSAYEADHFNFFNIRKTQSHTWNMKEFYQTATNRVNDLMSLSTDIKYYDISNIFRDHDETIFIDDVHITEEGNKIVAQKMYTDIKPIVAAKNVKLSVVPLK